MESDIENVLHRTNYLFTRSVPFLRKFYFQERKIWTVQLSLGPEQHGPLR